MRGSPPIPGKPVTGRRGGARREGKPVDGRCGEARREEDRGKQFPTVGFWSDFVLGEVNLDKGGKTGKTGEPHQLRF